MRYTRGEQAIRWIETYCIHPGGRPVRLTVDQRTICYVRYDACRDVPAEADAAIAPPLATYLALLHLVGPESQPGVPLPPFQTSVFELLAVAGPALRPYLRRDGEKILCDERATAWSRAA